MSHHTHVSFTEKGAQNVDTASSPHTFTRGSEPTLTALRNQVPTVSELKKRNVVPFEMAGVEAPEDPARLATLSFNLENVSAPFANMLRRVLMTEVPTMAIDRVLIAENDGVVLDELLSHRLGLCPIAAPAEEFEYLTMADALTFAEPSGRHVLKFELDVSVPSDPSGPTVHNVYSSSLKWIPLPGQEALVGKVRLVQRDVLLAKLGRGQRIQLQAFAVKGLGLTHAKWAPASACWYDMKTEIDLQKPLLGSDARRLVEVCPMDVFGIEETGEAFVKKPQKCTLCRECVKEENTDLGVTVKKNKTKVKFTVEPLGQYDHPEHLVCVALATFRDRCRNMKQLVEACNINDLATQ